MALFWRARAITAVALFLEGSYLYIILAVFASLTRFDQLQMPFWLVLTSLLWGYLLSSWILGMSVTPVLRGAAGLALGVPSLLVLTAWNGGETLLPFSLITDGGMTGVGLFVGSMIFLIVVWWRGVGLSQEDVTLEVVRSSFQVGVVVLVAASLIDAATEGRIVSGFLVVGFFAVGLLGMAVARFSSETGSEREMPAQWLLPIATCVAGVLVLGLLVSAVGIGGLDDVTKVVARAVAAAGYWMLEPVLMLIGLLAGALVNVGNWFSELMGWRQPGRADRGAETNRRVSREPEGSRVGTRGKSPVHGAAVDRGDDRRPSAGVDRLRALPVPASTGAGRHSSGESGVAVHAEARDGRCGRCAGRAVRRASPARATGAETTCTAISARVLSCPAGTCEAGGTAA